MPFEIVQNDIINMHVDVVVNTANPEVNIGSGVDRAIHQKAGKELLQARKQIGKIDLGDAKITPGFNLDAKYVIHTVGPIWHGGKHQEEQILASCYRKSLKLAKEYQFNSIAFPLLATGNYGFPKPLALQIAVKEISSFLFENDMQIYLVVFDKDAFALSEKLFKSVSRYIDAHYVDQKMIEEYDRMPFSERIYRSALNDRSISFNASIFPTEVDEWEEILPNLDATFSKTLLTLIDKTGKKDAEIYKKANVDRKLFSKIRNNTNYKPSKTTVLAFAFALELDINETKDLIGRAGYALSHSNQFDVIVEYFLVNHNYDIFELNEVLFAFDQPLLGA